MNERLLALQKLLALCRHFAATQQMTQVANRQSQRFAELSLPLAMETPDPGCVLA
jgi:hypothetical protein